METQEAKSIYQLIPKIMGEIGAIGKNGQNTFDNYKFRSIDDVYNKVQPVLAKNGVFFKPSVLESHESQQTSKNGTPQIRVKQKIEYTFFAADGSNFSTIVEGEAIDRSDKATNKAMTAALKYMLIQVFCIAIEGQEDADKDTPDLGADKSNAGEQKRQNNQSTPRGPNKTLAAAKDPYVFGGGKYQGKKFSDIIPEDFDAELAKYEAVVTKSKHLSDLISAMKKFKTETAEKKGA